jgi:hypothetical protein
MPRMRLSLCLLLADQKLVELGDSFRDDHDQEEHTGLAIDIDAWTTVCMDVGLHWRMALGSSTAATVRFASAWRCLYSRAAAVTGQWEGIRWRTEEVDDILMLLRADSEVRASVADGGEVFLRHADAEVRLIMIHLIVISRRHHLASPAT